MGIRVHIVAKYEFSSIEENGMRGFNIKKLYSPEQEDWFNNKHNELADWLKNHVPWANFDEDSDEWHILQGSIEDTPDEAFKHPVFGYTECEMRRFIAECIRCAKQTGGDCILEWF